VHNICVLGIEDIGVGSVVLIIGRSLVGVGVGVRRVCVVELIPELSEEGGWIKAARWVEAAETSPEASAKRSSTSPGSPTAATTEATRAVVRPAMVRAIMVAVRTVWPTWSAMTSATRTTAAPMTSSTPGTAFVVWTWSARRSLSIVIGFLHGLIILLVVLGLLLTDLFIVMLWRWAGWRRRATMRHTSTAEEVAPPERIRRRSVVLAFTLFSALVVVLLVLAKQGVVGAFLLKRSDEVPERTSRVHVCDWRHIEMVQEK
jgi:hypothetical protein